MAGNHTKNEISRSRCNIIKATFEAAMPSKMAIDFGVCDLNACAGSRKNNAFK